MHRRCKPPSACQFTFPERERHAGDNPDYARDVAPILRDNCAHCHRQGGIGPFALDSYAMVRGWSAMMREVLMTRRMPPAQIDPAIGHFSNARSISDGDLQTLVHWFDLGSPRGNGDDPLARLVIGDAGWQLGEPDYMSTSHRRKYRRQVCWIIETWQSSCRSTATNG